MNMKRTFRTAPVLGLSTLLIVTLGSSSCGGGGGNDANGGGSDNGVTISSFSNYQDDDSDGVTFDNFSIDYPSSWVSEADPSAGFDWDS